MPKYIIRMETDCPEIYYFLRWLQEEWDGYIIAKFGTSVPDIGVEAMQDTGVEDDGWWVRQILQYLDRARAFGLDTPKGRQALAKATATMIATTGAAIRVYGDLPKGGTTSGEIVIVNSNTKGE